MRFRSICLLGLQVPRLCIERVSLSIGRGVSKSPLSLVLCDGVVFHVRLHVMCFNVICKLEVLLCITQERLVSVLIS